ncbi:MAG: PEP-CTERM sorting domain-containing protein [Deltaproteobacteria bacterium]|nr:PEP-CTERM sorting domain-containing protein [Deltaproteobacteria bacterium]
MKKIVFATIMLFWLNSLTFAAAINLSSWTASGDGTWVLSGDAASVLQTKNGEPTYFVSDTNYINTLFDGSFGVETSSDDDFIGFVFGYTGPTDYILFDWKQAAQTTSNGTAAEGFTLSQITGSDVNLWGHAGADISVLDTLYGSDKGWADNTVYDFTLDYSTTGITIKIDGGTIFDISGSFGDGKFGFYNYSQEKVRYAAFDETTTVPIPGAVWLFGSGLLGLFGLRRKKR